MLNLPERRFQLTIAFRISLLSWVVTLFTLLLFVVAIIPQQKQDLQDALLSKALGVSSSLEEVTVGAALSEDYSGLVDQCVQVLSGDPAVDYLVVTRGDGLSVVVDRKGWRTATLDDFWRPEERVATSGIGEVETFHRRVFYYSRPFDYSGVQWGWIHVGLSLEAYQKSVGRIYWRTGLLAVLCSSLSFLGSVAYARRQVRPIRILQAVVQQVAQGDLTARAQVSSSDEIETLAGAFNSMADSLLQRNQILESVRFAAQQLLTADWRIVIEQVLAKTGLAAQASAAYLCEVQADGDDEWVAVPRFAWAGPEAAGHAGRVRPRPQWQGPGFQPWAEDLRAGRAVIRETGGPGALTFSVLVPIHTGSGLFGFIGFDDARAQRRWSAAETDSFRAVAGMLGASITRQRAQDELVESKATLEVRVVERTRELQAQMNAKERAHAELAEAQQRLIRLSRLSGMAEVATGVLHNVGNVLNSINVSSTLVSGRIQELRVDNLRAMIGLLAENQGAIDRFLREDAKGQRTLPYLTKLSRHFQEERESLLQELHLLRNHVGHIKEIVATQQSYAKVSGLIEDVCLASLVEDAFRMIRTGFERHEITIEKDFQEVPPVPADKHRILQILLNLLRNAQQAVTQCQRPQRRIRVSIRRHDEHSVRIAVADSGVGLAKENLTRIFAHGFTTKPDGHGFGLHSGALAAKEMGGSLWAESEGPGRGATFILELAVANGAAPAASKAAAAGNVAAEAEVRSIA